MIRVSAIDTAPGAKLWQAIVERRIDFAFRPYT